MEAATAERSELDEKLLAEQAAEIAEGDDGLGPVTGDDPNSEANTGIPGGRQPGDDGYVPPTSPTSPPPIAEGDGDVPPAPPANLPDDGGDDMEEEAPQLFLTGNKPLGVKVGGKKPESTVLKFKGGKVDLDGQFDLEDRITTVDVWQVTGDNNQHTIEKASGAVKASTKAQNATLCATRRLEDYLADQIEDRTLLEAVCHALDLEVPVDE